MLKKRSSYSITNAIRFKAFFDNALENKEDYFISSSRTNLSPTTLQQQISDSLLFLCQEYDYIIKEELMPLEEIKKHSQLEYMALKGMVNFKIAWNPEIGVEIKFKRHWSNATLEKKKKDQMTDKYSKATWREKVVEFIEKDEQLLHLTKLILSPEDINWVHNTLGGINCEYKVLPNEIIAAKERN